jgi:hypothetical protein
MKLPTNPRELDLRLLRDITNQVNAITEGQAYAFHGAMTAAPTTGTWNQGDMVKNSTPAEQGTAGSKYVVTHFICVASGTPGTWVSCRALTGN